MFDKGGSKSNNSYYLVILIKKEVFSTSVWSVLEQSNYITYFTRRYSCYKSVTNKPDCFETTSLVYSFRTSSKKEIFVG